MAEEEVRIEFNDAVAQEMLKSGPVQAELRRRAQAAAAAATAASSGGLFSVVSGIGSTRAHVRVFTGNVQARLAEAKHRTLTASLDAARG